MKQKKAKRLAKFQEKYHRSAEHKVGHQGSKVFAVRSSFGTGGVPVVTSTPTLPTRTV